MVPDGKSVEAERLTMRWRRWRRREGGRVAIGKPTAGRASLRLCGEGLERRDYLAADLVSQWRAEDLVASVPSGTVLTQWPDRVHGLVASATGNPSLVHGAVGGRAAVRFEAADGTDLIRVDRLLSPMSGAKDFSVALVFQTSANHLQGANAEWFKNTALVDSSSLGVTFDWGISLNSSGQAATGFGRGFGVPSNNLYSTQAALNDGDWHAVIVRRSGSLVTMQVDDEAVVQLTTHDQPLASLDLTMGGQKFGNLGFTGEIAELRVYSGALDDAQASALRSELTSFYSNQRPVAVDDHYTVEEDPLLFVQSAATGVLTNDRDADGDPITAVLVEATKHGSLILNPDGSFVYDSVNNFFGTDSFTYTANDLRASNPVTVTIEVTPLYDPPLPKPDSYRSLSRQVLEIPAVTGVLANDGNPDAAVLRAVLEQPPAHGRLTLQADGAFRYDPETFAGTTSFLYRVDDGKQISSPISATIVVNTAPVAAGDSFTATEDTRFISSRSVLSNDRDIDGQTLEATLKEPPTHGQLTWREDGTFDYQPNADFAGDDLFSYELFDGYDRSPPSLVRLTVKAVNDRPIARADGYVGLPNVPLQVGIANGLLANDIDVDDQSLAVERVSDPQHGTLELQAGGTFVYRPSPGFLGTDQFLYRTTDGDDVSEPVKVELTITTTPIRIGEILSANASFLATRVRQSVTASFVGPSTTPDWIELENLTSQSVNLGGMSITDDSRLPLKWQFPRDTFLAGNARLIVYASELNVLEPSLDENGRFHTNFSLARSGGYVALHLPDGTLVDALSDYPEQRADVSYGRFGDQLQYFTTPTPADANSVPGIEHVVSDTQFSVDRGFYRDPFTLEIRSETPGATLVFTTNGSEPSLSNGTRVDSLDPTQPPVTNLLVDKTTIVRARAFRDGYLPTNIDTQTYFFVADIVKQSTLSNTIKNHASWGPQLDDALLALPSVSIASGARFSEREVGTSVEMVFPDGTEGFQIDAGLEHFGGTSLSSSPKKSMRLSFKSKWGEGSLKYDLFGDGAVDEFEQLLLRSGSHDTWLWTHPDGGRGNFLRNRWAQDRQLEMGQLAPHARFVHVYINGVYWGMHELMERPEADFMASYEGGLASDYDVINAGQAVDGTLDIWRRIQRNEVIDNYDELKRYVDLENYADYMLLQFYAGNDWDWNTEQNWMSAGRRVGDPQFNFFSWDGDVMLRTTAAANVINRGGPSNLWNVNGGIRQHPEFKMLLADRAQKYFFDNGMFSDERMRADFESLAAEIRLPIIAESARWGGSTYTPTVWESAVKWMLDRFAPIGAGGRAETVIGQLRRANFFPSLDAPRFLVNGLPIREAHVTPADKIQIQSGDAPIYYTTDGSDPRLPGGELNPKAILASDPFQLAQSTTLFARALKDGIWSAIVDGHFLVNTVLADRFNLRISEIQYHPADPSAAEMAAGYSSADEFEFIELVNISAQVVDLRQSSFVMKSVDGSPEGIAFSFAGSGVEFLSPGTRVVVVENVDAFRQRYGDQPLVAGAWDGGLSNAAESVVLRTLTESIHDFRYSDRWFAETDGSGNSLQVVDERSVDLSNWTNSLGWRPSRSLLGSPGRMDARAGDANEDGVFNSKDLVLVFMAGQYEDAILANSTWQEGDWNDDGEFTSADLVLAFVEGGYSDAVHPAARDGASADPMGPWTDAADAWWALDDVQKRKRNSPTNAEIE